jgi:hypothetical protein
VLGNVSLADDANEAVSFARRKTAHLGCLHDGEHVCDRGVTVNAVDDIDLTAMTTSVRPILVTGATYRIGGTGRHVAAELVKRGLPVRALVRRLDERSEALLAMGIHLVVGDFEDYGSLWRRWRMLRPHIFSYPVGAGLTEAAGLFAAAGLERETALI